ncbi:MAG: hypothetical protein WA951_10670, partial [Leeuwenhoekiella sp.]
MAKKLFGLKILLSSFCISFLLFSCKTIPEDVIYFEDRGYETENTEMLISNTEPVFRSNDLVNILVSSPVPSMA